MDTMLSKALRQFLIGPLNQLIVNLGGKNGEQWEEELKKFLRKEPCWIEVNAAQVRQSKLTPFLPELVSTVIIDATSSKFVAKDRFVANTSHDAPVRISAVWDNFTKWFLSGDGKIEDPLDEQTIRYHKLRRSSVDGPIIAELGGEEKAEITLTEMFFLMKKQRKGEDGVLLNNYHANIFYIRDQKGVLRAVDVRWGSGGWLVDASPVGYPDRWDIGRRVFSRNSVLDPYETSVLVLD